MELLFDVIKHNTVKSAIKLSDFILYHTGIIPDNITEGDNRKKFVNHHIPVFDFFFYCQLTPEQRAIV